MWGGQAPGLGSPGLGSPGLGCLLSLRLPRTGLPSQSPAPTASAHARAMTESSIPSVSRPVNVFCWLG